jgi:hypothetical protein
MIKLEHSYRSFSPDAFPILTINGPLYFTQDQIKNFILSYTNSVKGRSANRGGNFKAANRTSA